MSLDNNVSVKFWMANESQPYYKISYRDFVKQIPVSWDEMKFIHGYPGKLAIIARRKGDKWFIAGINGKNHSKNSTLDLSFLPANAKGAIISDGKDQFTFNRKHFELPSNKKSNISLKGNGGFVILINQNS